MSTIISLYGGPGTGKSTSAAQLFGILKSTGVNAELVQEYVKQWAWEKRTPVNYDQFYFFGKQARKEYSLFGAVDAIVTDSPVSICAYYAHIFGTPEQGTLFKQMARTYFKMAEDQGHRHIHVWLNRVKPYNSSGRFQSEAEAKAIDVDMKRYLADQLGLELLTAEGSEGGVQQILSLPPVLKLVGDQK